MFLHFNQPTARTRLPSKKPTTEGSQPQRTTRDSRAGPRAYDLDPCL